MLRGWLIFVVSIGLLGSMMGHLSRGPKGYKLEPRSDLSMATANSSTRSTAEEGTVQLERSDDGHFYADVQINGTTVHALVDTGATGIALSREDARSAGLAPSIGMPEVVGRGANGEVRGEVVKLDRITLGHRSAENMDAVVLDSGEMTLLGQDFLSQFDSVEIHGDTMVLR